MIKRTIATLTVSLALMSCSLKDAVDDVTSTVAIKDVKVTTDTVTFEPTLPSVYEPGKTFSELLISDSAEVSNPANYGVKVNHVLQADNTSDNAKDATFNGAEIDIIVDTSTADTIDIVNDGFDVNEGAIITDTSYVNINAKDERVSCLYIFSKVADSSIIKADVQGKALWEVGSQSGDIPLPAVPVSIQTNASKETRNFLSAAIAAGIFEEE